MSMWYPTCWSLVPPAPKFPELSSRLLHQLIIGHLLTLVLGEEPGFGEMQRQTWDPSVILQHGREEQKFGEWCEEQVIHALNTSFATNLISIANSHLHSGLLSGHDPSKATHICFLTPGQTSLEANARPTCNPEAQHVSHLLPAARGATAAAGALPTRSAIPLKRRANLESFCSWARNRFRRCMIMEADGSATEAIRKVSHQATLAATFYHDERDSRN